MRLGGEPGSSRPKAPRGVGAEVAGDAKANMVPFLKKKKNDSAQKGAGGWNLGSALTRRGPFVTLCSEAAPFEPAQKSSGTSPFDSRNASINALCALEEYIFGIL